MPSATPLPGPHRPRATGPLTPGKVCAMLGLALISPASALGSASTLKTSGLFWPTDQRLSVPTGPGWATGVIVTGQTQPISMSDQQGRLFSVTYRAAGEARPLEQTLWPECRPLASVKTTPVLLAGPLLGTRGQVTLTWNDGGSSTLSDGERQRFWMWVYSPSGGRMMGTWRCRGGEELMATLVLPARSWTQVTLSRFLPKQGRATSTLQMNQGPGLGVWTPAWFQKTGMPGMPAGAP